MRSTSRSSSMIRMTPARLMPSWVSSWIRLRSRGHLDRDVSVECGHRDLSSKRGFGESDGNLDLQCTVSGDREDRVRFDAYPHIEVTAVPAALPRTALA